MAAVPEMNRVRDVYVLDIYARDPWHKNAFQNGDRGSRAEWDEARSFPFTRACWSAWADFQKGAATVAPAFEPPPEPLANLREEWHIRHNNARVAGGAHRCARYAETAMPLSFVDAMVFAALWCCRMPLTCERPSGRCSDVILILCAASQTAAAWSRPGATILPGCFCAKCCIWSPNLRRPSLSPTNRLAPRPR
jgi:hypothetical protein